MPTIYVTLYDNDVHPVVMPLAYKKIGNKYLYGPEANGKRRRPEPLHVPWWRKIIEGYSELFSLIRRTR